MQSNGLEAKKVVASRDAAGDGRGPCVVVGDHLATSPGAGGNGATDQASLVDLEPVQGCSISAIAVSIAVGHVGQLGQQARVSGASGN